MCLCVVFDELCVDELMSCRVDELYELCVVLCVV